MKITSFEAIASALHDADVNYLVAGGLAVNAHGYLRYTKDIDIVIQLNFDNITSAFAEPFDFDEEYRQAMVKLLGKLTIRFVSIPTLIRMKQIAGRTQDNINIEYLQKLLNQHE